MNRILYYKILFVLLPVLYFVSLPIETGDLAIWVALGKQMLFQKEIVSHDSYSVLNSSAMVYPVLSTFLYGVLDNVGGLFLISLFHKALVGIIIWIWVRRYSTFNLQCILVLAIALFGASFVFIERQALFGMFFFTLSYPILIKKNYLRFDYFKLVIINILWLNFHGSWLILLLSLSYKIIMESIYNFRTPKFNELLLVLILFISSGINPFGFKVFHYFAITSEISIYRQIDEWSYTSIAGKYMSQGIIFYSLMLLSILVLVIKVKGKEILNELSNPYWLYLFLGIGVVRNTIWCFFALPLYPFFRDIKLNQILSRDFENNSHVKLNWTVITFLSIYLIILTPYYKENFQSIIPNSKSAIYGPNTLIKISKYLNESLKPGNIFNEWETGSYLIYAQKRKIFLDTRNIIYSNNDFDTYMNVLNCKIPFEEIFQEYEINFIIMKKDKYCLESKLAKDWSLIQSENGYGLFERKI